MSKGGEIAKLHIFVARNVVGRSDGGEHLGLLDRIDAEVRFQIEIEVQHIFRIAGLLGDDLEHLLLNRIVGAIRRGDKDRRGRRCELLRRRFRGWHVLDWRWRSWRGRPRLRLRCQVGPLLVHESNHVCQGGIIAELAILIARNAVDLANGCEHFRLLDSVNAKVGFQVEIEVEHVLRISRFLDHQCEDAIFYRIALIGRDRGFGRRSDFNLGCLLGRRGRRYNFRGGKVRPLLVHESNHMRQRGVIAELAILIARNAVDLANGREHFRLLYSVYAEIGLQVEVQIQHVLRVSGLFNHQRKNAVLYRIAIFISTGTGPRYCRDDFYLQFFLNYGLHHWRWHWAYTH